MNNDKDRRARLIALFATLLVAQLVVGVLMSIYLKYTGDEPRVWPPEDTSELLLDGEYVMTGDIPQPERTDDTPAEQSAQEAAPETEDLHDTGAAAEEPAPVVSSKQESPVKVREKAKPEKTGPTAEELARIEQEKRQKEAAEKINKRVSFGGSDKGKADAGKSGSPNGNSNSGALSGMPGTNLKGRTLASWQKPSGTETGTIVVRVRVNRQGHVVAAEYSSGTGAIASSSAARRSCEQAAMKSRFSVDLDAPAEQTGTITYRFE